MAEQRERLLAATAIIAARDVAPSVASVAAAAGVGRNTFYEYFDDVAHAVAAAQRGATRALEQIMRDAESAARTPIERFRSLVRAWLSFAESEPSAALLALSRLPDTGALTSGGTVLQAALSRSLDTLRNAGVSPPAAIADRLLAAAATGEAFARAVARPALARESDEAPGKDSGVEGPVDRESLERSFVDVLVRLLR